MTGPEQLRAYLDREGRKQLWLAAQIGVTAWSVTSWLKGRSSPDSRSRVALEALCEISVETWDKAAE